MLWLEGLSIYPWVNFAADLAGARRNRRKRPECKGRAAERQEQWAAPSGVKIVLQSHFYKMAQSDEFALTDFSAPPMFPPPSLN
jgi:hypothetical protein